MPDGIWLPLLVRMVATGLVVVTATVVAERAGPMLGALLASLPVAAGPGYVFLAFEASPDFIAASALMSLLANAAIPPFLLVFTRLASRTNAWAALAGALAAWFGAVLLMRLFEWSTAGVVAANVVSYAACGALIRVPPVGNIVGAPRRWYELPLRAVLVGLVVGGSVSMANALGPAITGIGVVLPVAFSSLAVMLHLRLGGAVAAATIGRALTPMIGFAAAILVVRLGAVPVGVWPALGLALLTSLLWSAALLAWHRRGQPKVRRLR